MSTNVIATIVICLLMMVMLVGVLILITRNAKPVVRDDDGQWRAAPRIGERR